MGVGQEPGVRALSGPMAPHEKGAESPHPWPAPSNPTSSQHPPYRPWVLAASTETLSLQPIWLCALAGPPYSQNPLISFTELNGPVLTRWSRVSQRLWGLRQLRPSAWVLSPHKKNVSPATQGTSGPQEQVTSVVARTHGNV